jgi:hypothetical protein
LKPRKKTWQLSDTDNNLKFSKGDKVKVTIYSKDPKLWYIGKVLDINARYVVPSIESSWKVEYYVSFENVFNDYRSFKKGNELRYWFLESELRKYDLQEERNSRIDQLLN